MNARRALPSLLVVLLICCPLITGCVGVVANLLHVGMGNFAPAKYAGLAEQRVAVVCISHSSQFGPTAAAHEIAQRVENHLRPNVPEIQIIGQEKVNAWMDEHEWNKIDYREIGRGIGAQKLVAVEIKSFSLYEGKTLFKGRSDVALTVYDLTTEKGRVVYDDVLPQIQYPLTAGQYTADTTEEAFRRRFIAVVARRVARTFYEYDATDDFGTDPTALGF